jgi:hypothetical protein
MRSFSLASYIIKINNIDVHEPENLVDFDDSGEDLLDVLEGYLNELSRRLARDDTNQTTLKLRPPLNRIGRMITGTLLGGDYGITSQLEDVETGLPTHNRGATETEQIPLYFLIWIPEDGQRGLVLLQKESIHGIKTPLVDELQRRFQIENESLRLVVKPFTYRRLVEEYLAHGRVTEVRLIQYEVPDDIRALYVDRQEALKEVYVEYIVRAKTRKRLRVADRVRAVLEGRRNANNLVEIEGFEPQRTKLNIEINGKRRTIDMGDRNRLSLDFDITDEVRLGADGHPAFDSVDTIAQELLEELQQQLEREE